MSKRNDAALLASLSSRRDPAKLAADMVDTPMAQLAAQMKETTFIPLANIYTSPFQSRVIGSPEEEAAYEDYLRDLAATLKRESMLNPIIVRELESPRPGQKRLVEVGLPGGVLESNTPEKGNGALLDSNTPPVDGPLYELIGGENRGKAHILMGADRIQAKVLRLTDVAAARSLTADNLVRRPMTDWELYLHVVMLRSVGAASTQGELAALLCCSRPKVVQLESFGRLPERVHQLLGQRPSLLGASQVQALNAKGFLEGHADAVVEAVEKVAEGKISQSGMVGFIERRLRSVGVAERREYSLTLGRSKVRIVSKDGETRITGDVDADALRDVLQQHLDRLIKRQDEALPDQDSA